MISAFTSERILGQQRSARFGISRRRVVVAMPTGERATVSDPETSASLHPQTSDFGQLGERAYQQIAALAVTVARLERVRAEIERHLAI